MPTGNFDISELKRRMQGATQSLKHELGGLRTGRAAASMLEPVQVDAYGTHMPLNQLATISVPEPRLLSVQVWDKSMVKAVEKAIVDSNLGLSPATEGQVLRLRIPELNEDRRKELDRKSTRLNSSHTVIYTLSLHDALPICGEGNRRFQSRSQSGHRRSGASLANSRAQRRSPQGTRSEEHTSELQSHRDLHSFPTRRSSDLWRRQSSIPISVSVRPPKVRCFACEFPSSTKIAARN